MTDNFILPILVWPNDKLHGKCEDVTVFDDDLELLARKLLITMKHNNGIGLAAPQVGVLKNVLAIWIETTTAAVLVNPKITESSSEQFEFNEGCLSVPGYFEKRERPQRIVVKYQDIKGQEHETEFKDLYAFCVQHEIDHLNGKVFVDDLSMLKKTMVKAKIKKNRKKNK